jgi:phage-related tail protein
LKRNLTDQIDSFFNLISHIIIDVHGGFQNRVVEQNVCTIQMFTKMLELFEIPHIADILSKDNVIYREVFKTFVNEHPELLKTVHEKLITTLSDIE